MPNFFYEFHFYLFGLLATASAITFVTRRSPVSAALWLVVTMFCLAALYVMLEAHFIGAIQVLVYAGAIMVLFLFAIMMFNLRQPVPRTGRRVRTLLGSALALILLAELVLAARRALPVGRPAGGAAPPGGDIAHLGRLLFSDYLYAFEITSLLILAAPSGLSPN